MPSNRPRVLIADDHKLIADLCRNLLEKEFDVVGTVGDGRGMVRAALRLKPDVIIVDVGMPDLNGLNAGQQVKTALPTVKLIFLTMHCTIELAAEAFRRGASGYLPKTCAAAELVRATHKVLSGGSYLSPSLCRDEVNYLRRTETKLVKEEERLTERQREVLRLLAQGKQMKEIGDILSMTPRTVAFHKYRAMAALGAKSNAELVRYAVRCHLVSG